MTPIDKPDQTPTATPRPVTRRRLRGIHISARPGQQRRHRPAAQAGTGTGQDASSSSVPKLPDLNDSKELNMSKQLTRQQGDTSAPKRQTEVPPPPHGSAITPRRFRFAGSPWWRWTRRAVAVLTVLLMIGGWLIGQASTFVFYGPFVVVVVTGVQRIVARARGQLVPRFMADPFDRENRPYLVQFVLRTALAALVVPSTVLAIPHFAISDTEYALTLGLVAVSALIFALLQLVPARSVSKSLNVVAAIAASFLAFQAGADPLPVRPGRCRHHRRAVPGRRVDRGQRG